MKKEIRLVNEMTEISRLEDFVNELGTDLDLAPDVTMNINLALEEAIANIIMYAYPTGEVHDIILKVVSTKDQLVFLLADSGASFDPTQMDDVDITLSVENRPIGGLGVFLIRQIMNEVSYQRIDGVNNLIMKKKIN